MIYTIINRLDKSLKSNADYQKQTIVVINSSRWSSRTKFQKHFGENLNCCQKNASVKNNITLEQWKNYLEQLFQYNEDPLNEDSIHIF